jgi:hypothetical protein
VTAELGDGRHGPVFLGLDTATQRQVVIRTFAVPVPDEGRERFLDALTRLCDLPLDHAAIASPLACGEVDGVPFLVHEFMPGLPLDEYLRQDGRRSLSDVSLRVMHLAGAIDFAAAAGVVHGSLGPRDLLLEDDHTGVAGFGIAQALYEAGVETRQPSTADDLYALAAMTYEMLLGERYEGADVRAALASTPLGDDVDTEVLGRTLEATLSVDPAVWPASALQFAASLHEALIAPAGALPSESPDEGASTVVRDRGAEPLALPASAPHASAAGPQPGDPSGTLPLFDAPMRERGPHVVSMAGADDAHADIALRDDEPAIPLNPRTEPLPRGPFATQSVPSGPSRLVQAGSAVALVIAAVAVFLFLGGPSLFDDTRGQQAAVPQAPTDDAADAGTDTRLEETPDTFGDAFTPAPVLSDGPVAEREVASAPAEERRERPDPDPDPSPRGAPPFTAPAPSSPAPAASSVAAPAVSPPSVPRQPEAEVVTSGRVLVRSDPPGAQLFIDDELRGQTPMAVRDLTLGTHTITLRAPGLPPWSQQVTLTAERPAQSFEIVMGRASARPEASPAAALPPAPAPPASLQVESRPTGAQVWIDGRLVGTTPLQLSSVETGSHALRLELPGYRPWTTSVSVSRGERARVAASLEQ